MSAALVFQSETCTPAQREVLRCINEAAQVGDKTFFGISTSEGIGEPITLYGAVACFVGPDPDYLERARHALENGRDIQLEFQLAQWGQGGGVVGNGATVVDSIALIEQALDQDYPGKGVIMLSRANALRAAAAGALEVRDGKLQTKLGTPVIASAAAPDSVFGFGAIKVEEGPTVENDVIHPNTNRQFGLAEAAYAILVDCEMRFVSPIVAA